MSAETPKISKTTKKPIQLPWFETLRPLAEQNSLKDDEKARLHAIYTRFTLYDNALWKNHRRLHNETRKLVKAIHAYNELAAADPQPDDATQMQAVIIDIMRLKMTRIELDQLKILSKTQRIKRRYVPMVNDQIATLTLQAKKEELESDIEQAESDFNQTKSRYLKQAKKAELSHTSRFFKRRELYWRHNAHLDASNKTSTLFNFFANVNNIWLTLVHGIPGLLPFLNAANSFFQAIPIVNAVLSGIPLIFSAVKMVLKDKSNAKRALLIFFIAVFIAGLATAGLSVIAGTIVTAALMIAGAFVRRFIPMVQTQKELYQNQKELLELNQSDESLRNMVIELKHREQQHILIELENHLLQNKIDRTTYDRLKKLTQSADFHSLSTDTELKKIIPTDLETFLFNKLEERRHDLEAEITKLSQMNRAFMSGLFNTLVSLVGVLILPFFPPAGLILIGISSVIEISRQFSLTTKLLSAISKGCKRLYAFLMTGEPSKSSSKPSSTAHASVALDTTLDAAASKPEETVTPPQVTAKTEIKNTSASALTFIQPKQEGEGNHKGTPDDKPHPPQV